MALSPVTLTPSPPPHGVFRGRSTLLSPLVFRCCRGQGGWGIERRASNQAGRPPPVWAIPSALRPPGGYAAHQSWRQPTAAGPPGVTRSSKASRRWRSIRRRRRKAVCGCAGTPVVGSGQTRHLSAWSAHSSNPTFRVREGGAAVPPRRGREVVGPCLPAALLSTAAHPAPRPPEIVPRLIAGEDAGVFPR